MTTRMGGMTDADGSTAQLMCVTVGAGEGAAAEAAAAAAGG
jgi:hypothetical protein